MKIKKSYINAALQGAGVAIGIIIFTALTNSGTIFWWMITIGNKSTFIDGTGAMLLGAAFLSAYVLIMVVIFTGMEWIFERMARMSLL